MLINYGVIPWHDYLAVDSQDMLKGPGTGTFEPRPVSPSVPFIPLRYKPKSSQPATAYEDEFAVSSRPLVLKCRAYCHIGTVPVLL